MNKSIDFNLSNFDGISLSQMDGIKLMNRMDRKFIIPLDLLPHLLERLTTDYDIQEIENKRSFEYATLYFDTPDYEMYKAHQNGKLNRLKVRTREYIDSNLCFLEIKKKSNKGMTRKIRVANSVPDSIKEGNSPLFLSSNSPYCSDLLEAKLWSLYRRITLVNKARTERLTIDCDLSFRNKCTERGVSLPGMVIVEIKKEQDSYSPITDSLTQLRVKPKGMSKYCLGVALTENPERVKTNRFKSKLLDINKITSLQYE